MKIFPVRDVFDRICRSVEARYADTEPLCTRTDRCDTPRCGIDGITLDGLKARAVHGEPGSPEHTAVWRYVARHLRDEAADEGERDWMLITIWLLVPRLRGAAYAIARRTGAERADVCSALLQGALEAAQAIEKVDAARVEQHLIDTAFTVGWQTGRRSPRETPVGDVWERDRGREEMVLQSSGATPGEVICVDVMTGAIVQRAQGERLGSLAYRMGLLAHVRRERRHLRSRQGRPLASTHQIPGRAGSQPDLFEMWGPVDEAPS
ncbi:hypothetical protein [Streptomyces sp. NPDC017940]|uniref:hypothetical protein n=1 Tax=Streptomyces sp. NPDC017940 TaxID=3365017 RepID=UPI0037A7790E